MATASDLKLKKLEQQDVLESSSVQLTAIKGKLKEYRETTEMKDDHNKFNKAASDLQQESDLTQLTMLALKITEEIKRAQANE